MSDVVPTFCEVADFTDSYLGSCPEQPEAILFDARAWSRARARSSHAREYGLVTTEFTVTTAYVRWLDRQEQWEDTGRDRWIDQSDEDKEFDDEPPELVPDDWEADEYDHTLCLCKRETPGAVKVWRCKVPS